MWGVVVHAADIHDGVKAHLLVEHCLGYLERMRKILVDDAYKKVFYAWVKDNFIGLDIEFASKPPTEKGFVPVKWRWVNAAMELKGLLDGLIFSGGMPKTMRKQLEVPRLGFCGLIAKLS